MELVRRLTSATRMMVLSVVFSVIGMSAWAVSVTPFDTPLSAGDSTLGNAVASAGEDFGMTALSLTAATDLGLEASITINPFFADLSGNPSNSISLAYSIDGGTAQALAISVIDVGVGFIGATGLDLDLVAGSVLSFFISGVAGQSGNQVTFAIETTELQAVPLAPAAAFLLTGFLGLGALRRKKSL